MSAQTAPGKLPRWLVIASVGRRPKWTFVRVAFMIVVSFVLLKYVLVPIRVEGVSMEPTYRTGQYNFINRLAYVHHGPRRGDVVGVPWYDKARGHVLLLKRVVGLPGETIAFSQGTLCVNSVPVEEPYVKKRPNPRFVPPWEMPPVLLAPEEYYVVGDNRSMPIADHTKGQFSLSYILGEVLWGAHP